MLSPEDSKKVSDAKLALVGVLKHFMPATQRAILIDTLRGEERVGMAEVVQRVVDVIGKMPKTGETDGQGDAAMVHLHYFYGSIDAWITEKDEGDGSDDLGQHQAFGKVDLGYGGELGYVSIQELIENGVELDLYFQPKPLKDVK